MEALVMAAEVGEMTDILEVLVGTDFTREEIDDALGLTVLNLVQTSGELPDDPELAACLERWQARVVSATTETTDFFARVEQYLEQRPPRAELIAALQLHFEKRQSTHYERDRARSEQFLAMPMARMTTAQKPAGGQSWLSVRVSTCTPKI